MDPCIPDSRLGFHESFARDYGELEDCHNQVNDMVTKVDGLSQKLKEVEQFYSITNNEEQNTSKLGSIFKDKDKDKLIANLMKRQQDAPDKEAAATKRMLDIMRLFGTIISQITQHKWAVPFMEPVDVVGLGLHDYYEIIEKPMDFSTIKKKMDCKDGSGYKHVRDIWVDVRLIFKNAMKYNDEKHGVHEMARHLLAKFEERWLTVIYPKIVDELKWKMEERSDTQLYMRLTQEVAHAKMARDLSNELDEVDLHLEEFKGLVLQRCRKMTTEEKRRLATALTKLPPDDLNEALMIVAEDNPCFQASATEVDLDIDSQGELTLWKLKFFLKDKMQAAGNNSIDNHNNGINVNDTNTNKPVAAGANKNNNSMNKRKREFCDAIAIAKNFQKKAKDNPPPQMHNNNNNNNPRK